MGQGRPGGGRIGELAAGAAWRTLARRRALLACCCLVVPLRAPAQALVDGDLPPFVTTPARAVERMLAMAQVGPQDTLLDLGSGDGRIVIQAAKRRGARALGIEMDPNLVALSRANAQREGVGARARFERGDALAADLAAATVVTLYLSPELNERLLPKILHTMRPGSRVVSHDFALGNWTPDRVERVEAPEKNNGRGGESVLMLWIVPADAAGRWRGSIGTGPARRVIEFSLGQQYQFLEAVLHAPTGGRNQFPAALSGDQITLALPAAAGPAGKVRARVDAGVMTGAWHAPGGGASVPFEARRIATRPDL